jgi:hypothetical protein
MARIIFICVNSFCKVPSYWPPWWWSKVTACHLAAIHSSLMSKVSVSVATWLRSMLEVHHSSDLANGVITFYMKTSTKPAQDITSLKCTDYCRNAVMHLCSETCYVKWTVWKRVWNWNLSFPDNVKLTPMRNYLQQWRDLRASGLLRSQ